MMRATRWFLVVAVAAVSAVAVFGTSDLRDGDVPDVLSVERDGLVFTFHVLSGTESLFDLSADPRRLRNLVAERPDVALAMRKELAEREGVIDLEDLRDPGDPLRRQLESHGYLR